MYECGDASTIKINI